MNKYRHLSQSKSAAKERRRKKTCKSKRAYSSAEEAQSTGNDIYRCPYCNAWHTTAKLRKLAKRIERLN